MTVSVRFSQTTLGEPVSLPVEVGTFSSGATSPEIDIYISHSGTSAITNCKLYALPYAAGVYVGSKTPQDDYETTLGWGDDSYPATSGGGLYLNMNYSGGFPDEDWEVFRTGYGDTLGTAISLTSTAISTGEAVAGEIQPSPGEAHVRLRLDIPAAFSTTGTYYVDLLLSYSYTS